MENCIFCSIANGEPEKLVWQSETVAVFKSIQPNAPVHLLVVPKRHFARLDDVDDPQLLQDLMVAVQAVARQQGTQDAYRVHINNGRAAGQVVDHLHIHVLGKLSAKQLDDLRTQQGM